MKIDTETHYTIRNFFWALSMAAIFIAMAIEITGCVRQANDQYTQNVQVCMKDGGAVVPATQGSFSFICIKGIK